MQRNEKKNLDLFTRNPRFPTTNQLGDRAYTHKSNFIFKLKPKEKNMKGTKNWEYQTELKQSNRII